jgi:hypothetical protein
MEIPVGKAELISIIAVAGAIFLLILILLMSRKKRPALSKCMDCGHKVSSKAWMCPGCGRKHPCGGGTGKIIVAVIILAIIAGGVVAFLGLKRSPPSQRPVQPYPKAETKRSYSVPRSYGSGSGSGYYHGHGSGSGSGYRYGHGSGSGSGS